MNWDLSRLYSGFDDPALAADMGALEAGLSQARAALDAVPAGEGEAAALGKVLLHMQEMRDLAGKLQAMVQLSLAADAGCEAALAPRARLMELGDRMEMLESALARRLSGADVEALCRSDGALREHAPYLKNLRARAAHLLDPALEPAVRRMQQSGGQSWSRLRDELFAGLTVEVALDGELRRMPLSAARCMDADPRPEAREAAFRAELAAYPKIETAMAACLSGIKGEALTMARLQNYESVLDWSLHLARMDRETLDALIQTMRDALPLFQRYFRLKARCLGRERLRFCDLAAPLGGGERRYTLAEARDLLLEVFSSCHPPIAEVMRRAFDERWIDAYPRAGKEGGAFCEGVHALGQSYVLTNFDGSYGAVSTLAHELGHAYHDSRVASASALLCDIPMPLAETASTFNELVLAERVLARSDGAEALAMLDQQLADAAQVIVDILSRFLFESEVLRRREGSTLSARELSGIMEAAQRETYGDGLEEGWLHPYMWACKPHYYDPVYHFYNYPYAFGQLFAASLYARWREVGDAFWPMYDRMLRLSGSASVREAAAAAGVDVSRPEFWRGGLEFFENKLAEMEKRAPMR